MATSLELWHLLSLDAPTVAATWTWFVARCTGVHPSLVLGGSLFLAVWILYSADRLLDCRPLSSGHVPDGLEERHHFHYRHRRAFLVCIACASVSLLMLLPFFGAPTLRLYAFLFVALAAWLCLVYTRHGSGRNHGLPKEFVVGPFFAAAIFIPLLLRATTPLFVLLCLSLLLAAICTLNCLLLYAWEHAETVPRHAPSQTSHPVTRWAVRHLPVLALFTFTVALLGSAAIRFDPPFSVSPHLSCIPLACTFSTLLLFVLHLGRRHLRPLLLRAAADAVLLTPLLFLPWLR